MQRIASTCSLLLIAFAALSGEDAGAEPAIGTGTTGTTTGQGQNLTQGDPGNQYFFFIIIGAIVLMLWTMSRKQKREQREHQSMISAIKTGQKVITAGGIHGVVVRKGEDSVDVRTGGDDGAIITFGLNAISKVVDGDKPAAAQA